MHIESFDGSTDRMLAPFTDGSFYMRMMLAVLVAAIIPNSYADMVQLRKPGAEGLTLALHCVEPAKRSGDAVLFIHGASFPTMLAAGFEFDRGDSWMNFMANRGFLSCGLDFLGFGASSRPPAMETDPAGATPIDLAADAAVQIAAATDYMIENRKVKRLHIVAHSWAPSPRLCMRRPILQP